jgi:large subunit ribosomal protein L22
MEARAINRYIGSSPRKMRLVIDLIRGKSVDAALHILHFSPKHASKVAEKVLRSAVSNLQNKDEGGRLSPEDMVVKEAFVDGGMTMKRISPAPMGRAYRIRKRSNHVTIIVESKAKPSVKKAAPASKPAAKADAKAPKKKEKQVASAS